MNSLNSTYIFSILTSVFFISSFSHAQEYDTSFSVSTSNGYIVSYDREENLLSLTNSDGLLTLSGVPQYSESTFINIAVKDRLMMFNVYGANSNATLSINRYFHEPNTPEYTRKATLVVNENGVKSSGKVTNLQEFMAEEDRSRYRSFVAQTTQGGWIRYNTQDRLMTIIDENTEEVYRGYAFLNETTSVSFGNRPLEYMKNFSFQDQITDQEVRVVLGVSAFDGELESASIHIASNRWYQRDQKVAEFFNLEYIEDNSPPICRELLLN